jgi:hypothetical protein
LGGKTNAELGKGDLALLTDNMIETTLRLLFFIFCSDNIKEIVLSVLTKLNSAY